MSQPRAVLDGIMAMIQTRSVDRVPIQLPSMMQPVSVLLVEDSVLLAERLRELIGAVAGVELLATVDKQSEAIDVLSDSHVDVVILDLMLKSGTGFGVLHKIASMQRRPVAIVYTNYPLPEYRVKATNLGAEYFLDKSRDYDRLVEILQEMGKQSS